MVLLFVMQLYTISGLVLVVSGGYLWPCFCLRLGNQSFDLEIPTVNYRHLTFTLFLVALTSCGKEEQNSDVKIDAGRFITATSENKVSGVVSIGGCTATTVSDNTVVTAGHCVSDGGQVCVAASASSPRVCSSKVFTPSEWKRQAWESDIAVAIFPNGTFKHYFEVATEALQRNQPVVMVGYSKYSISSQDANKGSKRWGRNIVGSFQAGNVIITTYGSSADKVAVNPGDSGGPMFHECKLVGVTSRTSGYGTFAGKTSLHTNVQYGRNMDFLTAMKDKGAFYCGLPGTPAERCPVSGRAEKLSTSNNEDFPCSETGKAGPNSGGGLIEKLYWLLDSKTNDSNTDIYISAPASVEKVNVCKDVQSSCDSNSDIELKLHSTKNGMNIFKSTSANQLNDSFKDLVAAGFSKENSLRIRTTVRLERK